MNRPAIQPVDPSASSRSVNVLNVGPTLTPTPTPCADAGELNAHNATTANTPTNKRRTLILIRLPSGEAAGSAPVACKIATTRKTGLFYRSFRDFLHVFGTGRALHTFSIGLSASPDAESREHGDRVRAEVSGPEKVLRHVAGAPRGTTLDRPASPIDAAAGHDRQQRVL